VAEHGSHSDQARSSTSLRAGWLVVTDARLILRQPATHRRVLVGTIAAAVVVGILLPIALNSAKIEFYVDQLERSGLLYGLLALSLPAVLLVLKYPRVAIYACAFLLPFNIIGGEWGDSTLVSVTKVALNLLLIAALGCTALSGPARYAWLFRTRLGVALLAWLAAIGLGAIIGLVGNENRSDWIRESNWMSFYAFAAAVGTLVHERRDVRRVIWAAVAGAAVIQAFAFYRLATGQRYERLDSWTAGATFFRAPFSSATLFVLFLSIAAVLLLAARKQLTWKRQIPLLSAVTAFGGGLMASMGRSLWLSAVVGGLAIVLLSEWNRRTLRAAVYSVLGIVLALLLVAAVDRLSPSSSGNWTANAAAFMVSLSEDSASTTGRKVEWDHALDMWSQSPVLGAGFGAPFPVVEYSLVPLDKFYMHNSYLNVLAKCGLVGLLALVALVLGTVVSGVRTLRSGHVDLFDRIILTAVVASLVQMMTLSLFSPVITTTDSVFFFAMLIGLTAAMSRTIQDPSLG
jgi:hypothetical protein